MLKPRCRTQRFEKLCLPFRHEFHVADEIQPGENIVKRQLSQLISDYRLRDFARKNSNKNLVFRSLIRIFATAKKEIYK